MKKQNDKIGNSNKQEEKEEKTVYVPQYQLKERVVTECEQDYMEIITNELPKDYILLVQQPLNAFIIKIKQFPGEYQTELNRVVDFLVVDSDYAPLGVIEINDRLHKTTEKKARDEKVKDICEKANIPILMLDTDDNEKSQIRREVRGLLSEIKYKN